MVSSLRFSVCLLLFLLVGGLFMNCEASRSRNSREIKRRRFAVRCVLTYCSKIWADSGKFCIDQGKKAELCNACHKMICRKFLRRCEGFLGRASGC